MLSCRYALLVAGRSTRVAAGPHVGPNSLKLRRNFFPSVSFKSQNNGSKSEKFSGQKNENSSELEKNNDSSEPEKTNNSGEKLYFGRFTEEEYHEAAEIVKKQMKNLEKQIVGETNPRDKLAQMQTIPANASHIKRKPISSLSDILQESIKTGGPMSLSSYMRQCLTNPDYGYYTTRDPLDTLTGDFITSPEISLVFGEMIGIWLYSIWIAQGQPQDIRVIEFGPGKGTLMLDVVTCFHKLNKTTSASKMNMKIVMIEQSPVLMNEQAKLLCNKPLESSENGTISMETIWPGCSILWVETEKHIPDDSTFANYILAHEFFDALPIKAFEKVTDGTWREYLVEHSKSVLNTQGQLPPLKESLDTSSVDLDETLETDFHLTLSPKETPIAHIPKHTARFAGLPAGSLVEICPDAQLYMSKMAQLVENGKGAVLVMDYGISLGVPQSTLRGIYKHKFVSPFFRPGEVDLSIDVDFPYLKEIVEGPAVGKGHLVFGPVDQGDWLHNIGIGYRIDQLLKQNQENPEAQDKIYDSYLRLTGKDDKSMGKVYKFMAVLPPQTGSCPGFL